MLPQVKLEDVSGMCLVGSRITDGKLVMTFSDPGDARPCCFVYARAYEKYGDPEIEVEEQVSFECSFSFNEACVELGIITQDELDEQRRRREERWVQQSEAAERAQFERLKKKFKGA